MAAKGDTFAPALAASLVADWGVTGSYSVTPSYDPVSGQVIASEMSAAFTVTPPQRYQEKMGLQASTALQSSSVAYTIDEIEVNTYVTINGKRWKVVRVDPIVSGEQVAAYRLWLNDD